MKFAEAEVSECIEVPDKKDPSYESKYGLGASFSTPEELRMAIRLWHFHHTKTFKYKKNNLKKLEASCDQEEDCSFYLLALKKGDKLEVTKTTPHSCSQLTYTDDLAQKSLGRAYFKANELVHLFPTGMEISRSTVQEVLEKPHGFSSLFFETGYSKTLIKNIQVAAKKLQRLAKCMR
uniref:Transposase MuDR plant domain-containing protein n=1 Tax=Palpitomonas bilix TaxID=652834 RepID=A0A7S3D6R8_9EUKA|mmetsp:Transcript_24505/g.62054  ORF Transcript_24505/g.62054 Transcript_24505/m.62054 type:complete len:178 (+) Transcript_24505:320-853(+)